MEITQEVLKLLENSAELAYPDECCGFIFSPKLANPSATIRGQAFWPVANSSDPQLRRRRFLVEPEDFAQAELAAEAQGLELTAIHHSHPDHPAEPSGEDLAKAWPFYHYLITAVSQGQAQETTCWRLAADRSGFVREPLIVLNDL
ncbi:MAG: M67 family metallopeptidase [Deltaproteobacteria bacterium]|jgi:proteasome lid subunit RPN8/RPN11|nr:M67 family metallopeptidase [Deltaproteobacteria bacterium]